MADPLLRAWSFVGAWSRRGIIALIRGYQLFLSPVLPAVFGPACGCRFHPSCSHYAIEALREQGVLRGSLLTLRRLARCTPLHPGGFDPVPRRRPRCEHVPAH